MLQRDDPARVLLTSRDANWCQQPAADPRAQRRRLDLADPLTIQRLGEELRTSGNPPTLVINCTGLLHGDDLQPERALKHLSLPQMQAVFGVNTFGVALLLKEFLPLFDRKSPGVFASISARVGSISDNRLGGWYSYRASKAAQNMMIRTAAIEAKRTHQHLICVALHPGTVSTALSAPFTKRKHPDQLFSPGKAADHLLKVLGSLTPADTGLHFAWDGQVIPW